MVIYYQIRFEKTMMYFIILALFLDLFYYFAVASHTHTLGRGGGGRESRGKVGGIPRMKGIRRGMWRKVSEGADPKALIRRR